MVRDDQWNPLVAMNPNPWGVSIFSPDVLDQSGPGQRRVHSHDVGGGFSAQKTAS